MKIITTLFLISILFISPVSALIAGMPEAVLEFDNCSDLTVKVTGTLPIDVGEYEFLNCSLIGDNEWSCACYDGYELIINTTPITLNNYTITAEYEYEGKEPSTSGGGSGRIYHADSVRPRPAEKCKSAGDCVNMSLEGCEYDGCNYCCYNECTVMACFEEEEDIIIPDILPPVEETFLGNESEKEEEQEEEQPEPVKKGYWKLLIPFIILLILIFIIYKKYKKGEFKEKEDEMLNSYLNNGGQTS